MRSGDMMACWIYSGDHVIYLAIVGLLLAFASLSFGEHVEKYRKYGKLDEKSARICML